MVEAIFATVQVSVGPDLRSAEQIREIDGRLALRRRDDELRQPRHRWSGDADDWRYHADAARGRTDQGAPAYRHTGSFIYQVAKGKGYSIIDGKRFDWKERDIFCVPSWSWHEHGNASNSEDACLFSFNDMPVIGTLGLYREEVFGDNDGYQLN